MLANRAGLSERSYRRIEHGDRRTRASTLRRIGDGLVAHTAALGTADEVTARLLQAAGPNLADESKYRSRVKERRRRRMAKQDRRPATEHTIEYMHLTGVGVVQYHRHRRWVTREATREHEYYVLGQRSK